MGSQSEWNPWEPISLVDPGGSVTTGEPGEPNEADEPWVPVTAADEPCGTGPIEVYSSLIPSSLSSEKGCHHRKRKAPVNHLL